MAGLQEDEAIYRAAAPKRGINMYRVLLVDDDREVLQLNSRFLEGKGYAVETAENAQDALSRIGECAPHCIVLDVMMPETDGFAAFPALRRATAAPILFLTGKSEEAERIRGLTLGADDYIVKPCSLEELSLRIMINIRKMQKTETAGGILEFPPLKIDLLGHRAYYEAQELPLSNREFDLLALLAKHAGAVLTFREIGEQMFGSYLETDRKNIMVNASRLRKKLEGYVGLEHMIETVWGKGYRFNG